MTRSALFLSTCFVSIGALLSHLGDGPRMLGWALIGFPLAAGTMLGAWLWAWRDDDTDFLLRIRVGLVGGLLGTIGYDLFRIPFDIAGANTLAPIRVYGLWTTGSSGSTLWTDLAGFSYHLSNGVTFAWIYAIVMLRRHWAWAIGWGLLLETLAVLSPFGEVFAIRKATYGLVLAYLGHVWYGLPLGLLCQDPERLRRWRVFGVRAWGAGALGNACVCAWFVLFQYAGVRAAPPSAITIGPESIRPTWRDASITESLLLTNPTASELEVLVRTPTIGGHTIHRYSIAAQAQHDLALDFPGIYQIQVFDRPWRSVFIAVHDQGRYRRR